MQTIPNVATQDAYVDALTLGPDVNATQLVYVVANAAVFAQFRPISLDGTVQDYGPEVLLTPTANTVQRCSGVRFRSAVAGTPARIVAQLLEPADPQFGGGVPFSSTLAATGGLTPGVASVQVEKDGTLVGQEAALNFIGTQWTIADNGALGRIDITPTPGGATVAATLTALNAALPLPRATGTLGVIEVGAGAAAEYVPLIWDNTRGKWVSETRRSPLIAGLDTQALPTSGVATANYYAAQNTNFFQPQFFRWRELQVAGLSIEARVTCYLDWGATGAATSLTIQPYLYGSNAGGLATSLFLASFSGAVTPAFSGAGVLQVRNGSFAAPDAAISVADVAEWALVTTAVWTGSGSMNMRGAVVDYRFTS